MTFQRGQILGIGLTIVSLISLGIAGYTSYQSQAYAECQSDVNDSLVVALNARTDAAEQERLAERRADDAFAVVMNALIGTPVKPEAERLAALESLRAALNDQHRERAEADAARVRNPLPAPASRTCG